MKKNEPNITGVLARWNQYSKFPGGKWLFSKMVGLMIPYTGSIKAKIETLTPGECTVVLLDRKSVRNHLNSVHAIALTNLGEFTSGLAMTSALPQGSRVILKGLSIEYLKKARGTIRGKSKVVLPAIGEKTEVPVTAELIDSSGEKVAIFKSNWQVSAPK
ncbi:MAG: DUF4442 domain-containing protein [Xanthomonadaceae bacterium]|nr:DUF4442 domain-containing protein [Xanthomonadaceae bacterium]